MKGYKNNHMRLARLLTFSLILLLSFGAFSLGALAADEENGITLNVVDTTGDLGALVSIPVTFTSDGAASGMQFDLSYDPDLLTYQGTPENLLLGYSAGDLPDGFAIVASKIQNNKIRTVVYNASGNSIPEGDYTLINLKFRVKSDAQPAQESDLVLSGVKITDVDTDSLMSENNSGVFTVTSSSEPVGIVLTAGNVTGKAGDSVSVPITLQSEGNVAGLQFTLDYDDQLLTFEGIDKGALTDQSGAFTVEAELTDGGVIVLVLANTQGTFIDGEEDTVAQLNFTVASGAKSGQFCDLEFDNVVLSDDEGDPLIENQLNQGKFIVAAGSVSDKLILTAGNVSGRAGTNVSLPITLLSEGNVAGIQFTLDYDDQLLTFKDITKGAFTDQSGAFTVVAESSDGGVIVLVLANTPGTFIKEGQGIVAKLNFNVASNARPGQSCDLELNNVIFSDDQGEPLMADQLNDGEFTVATSGGGGGGGGGSKDKDEDKDETPTPSQPDCSFIDLTTSHWAYKDIIALCEAGIIDGYPDGTFGPEISITRAEFAKIIVGVQGTALVNPAQATYQDVARNNWHYQYVETATQAGLVMGDGKGYFRPNDRISRQEIAIILVRAMGLQNEAIAKAQEVTTFGDDSQISPWARGHVVVAVEQGLINGYPGNPPTFKAKNTATRAEASAMLNRYRNQ